MMATIILAIALIGHGFLWVALINVTHAVRIPKWLCATLSAAMFFLGGAIPLGFAAEFWMLRRNPLSGVAWSDLPTAASAYAMLCAALGPYALARWVVLRLAGSAPPGTVRYDRRRAVDVLSDAAEFDSVRSLARADVRWPGNEILDLDLVHRGVELAYLPARLAGMSILHLSDVHLTGRIDRRYYERLVELANAQECDLIALTGDLIDRPECIEWLPSTLGRLHARHGAYFILGNHDYHEDHVRIRRTLVDCGLIDVGGRRHELMLRDRRIVVAGIERPWFPQVPDLGPREHSGSGPRPLRLVLAHSPDQFGWACRAGADLVLSGHTHAGQIQLPGIGPIFTPCLTGVRYAEGVFRRGTTVLHVTRGVSAKLPVRYLCRPEMVRLELCAPAAVADAIDKSTEADDTSRLGKRNPEGCPREEPVADL